MRTVICVAILALAACSREAPPVKNARRPVTDVAAGQVDIGGANVNLPQRVGEWTRPETPRRITAETIFDYMDGAGELYLAYRFDHLDVVEFKPGDASLGTILVEMYSMKSPDDAFGLLSNDWGGEPVAVERAGGAGASDGGREDRPARSTVPSARALYGAGLLRMWVGDRYVRVLASREDPDSREAVLRLGREIMSSGLGGQDDGASPPPGVVRGLASEVDAKRPIRPERTCFFRSYLVLNSQYFLASQDILGLGPDVAAATTEYAPGAPGERPLRAIVARYPTAARAAAGLASFTKAYLPEIGSRTPPARGQSKVEHGWLAWASGAQDLVVVLDAATADAARAPAGAILEGLANSTSK